MLFFCRQPFLYIIKFGKVRFHRYRYKAVPAGIDTSVPNLLSSFSEFSAVIGESHFLFGKLPQLGSIDYSGEKRV